LKFSLSTGTLYPYPLRHVFRWARATGFEGVELVVNPEAILRGGQRTRQLAMEQRIEILSVHPTLVPLPGWRERHGGFDPTVRWALEAGAGLVVFHIPRTEGLEEGEGLEYTEKIEGWQARLSGTATRLALENKAVRTETERRYALSPLDRLRAFADYHDLGLVLDTVHAGTSGEDLLDAWRTFGGRLVNVHVSDQGGHLPLGSSPFVQRALGEHRFPGAGTLPLAELLGSLSSTGYEGPVTLEVNPVAMRFWWPPAVRRRLSRALAWMEQATRHWAPRGGAPS
jgi:sugar phosphate isomerase/epimerase